MHPAAPPVADRWSERLAVLELLGWVAVAAASVTLFLSYVVEIPVWLLLAACVVGFVAALAVGRAAWRTSRRRGEGFWRSLRASLARSLRFLADFMP